LNVQKKGWSAVTEPRWLSQDEQKVWVAYLLSTRLLWAQFERDVQRGARMPLTYYEILSVLSELPDRSLRMSDLSKILQVSPSRLSHAATRLEEAGWIRRELCASDRRGWVAVLTDAGMEAVRAAAPAHVDSVRHHLFDQLTPAQIEQIGDISTSLLSHLAPGVDVSGIMDRRKGEALLAAEDVEHLPSVSDKTR
jgi:DNA-binding MarR family transcriptional regulator